ncbi:MAG: hypothetical protein GXZ02_06170 [Clostridiales bacterium]|nr:hypothetical protein [Clostridiales bacterium]
MEENLHEGHRKRLKQKYLNNPSSLAEHELLEILLFYAVPRRDTNEIAIKMIKKFGTLSGLCDADVKDIANVCDVKENIALLISLVSKISNRNESEKAKNHKAIKINSPENAGRHAIELFRGAKYEQFYLICLNSQKWINYSALVQEGTINEVAVYTRLIVELALRHKAHSVILSHNHPGGSLTPSKEDIDITRAIEAALETINIIVNDHIIVSGDQFVSLKQHNYI